jgi:uncharacterized delta-60 repeat protein
VFTDGGSGNSDIGIAHFLANGTLDTVFSIERIDFGVGGIPPATFDGGEWDLATDVMVQGDGKILIGGYTISAGVSRAALVRLMSSGAVDTSFGSNGLVRSAATDRANGIALQADGRIVIAGNGSSDFGLERYTSEGVLDTSFGSSGQLLIDFFGAFDSAADVLIQPDGKIVAAGSARNGTSGAAIVRVLP